MADFMDTWDTMTKDRNFLSLLAGMGSKFGAGGTGEMIGTPTLQTIQSMAMQEAIKNAETERSKWNKALFDLISGGGLTPKGVPGPREVKTDGEKTTLVIDTGKPPASADLATGTSTSANVPQLSAPRMNLQSGKPDLADALGFSWPRLR